MLDALGANEGIGNALDIGSAAAHHQHLKAVVVIQVNMQCGEYIAISVVLHVCQLLVQEADVVVVDERDRADDFTVRALPHFTNQFVADEVAKGLRTVGIAPLFIQLIEFLQELSVDGDADPAEFTHVLLGL